MDQKLQKAFSIIFISLGVAFIFNFLFFSKMIGISAFIFVIVLLGVVIVFGYYQKVSLQKTWWLILLVLFFSLMPGVRANEFLIFLNICSALGLLMLFAHQINGMPAFILKAQDYIVLAVLVPFRMFGRALATVFQIGQIHSNIKHRDVWIRVIKGALMAVPILILFGVLFSQADLAFSQFLSSFIHVTVSERTIQYIVLFVFAFTASMCFLSYIFFPKQKEDAFSSEEPHSVLAQSGRSIEILVFLSLISLLFLLFIGFQVTYLFGGEANIANAGFTYAEYARRGFWELLAVAILSLLVLLLSEKYAKVEQKKDKLFLMPALVVVTEVMVVMISAFKRLSLYIDAYSMTEQRFYVAAFIMLLGVLFILLAIKFIGSKPEQFFTFGAFLSLVGFLIVINSINPDAFIARSNIEQFNRTGKVDALYVGMLSADAEKEKVELYYKLETGDRQIMQDLLGAERDRLKEQSTHWQSFNLSRTKALSFLQNFQENKQ